MSSHLIATIVCNNIFLVLFYYFNTQYLIPQLLMKEKWGLYVFSIISILLLFLFLPNYIAGLIASPEIRPIINLNNSKNPGHQRMRRRGLVDTYNIAIFFLVFTVGTCIAVIQRWLKIEETRKETESQRVNTELSFLKSQINPHFFFNTLNNIYSLAIIRSEKTAPAVMKLSSIMRYILTETTQDLVPLQNEVDFINNYIELQQVRLTDKTKVNFNAFGDIENKLIAPLIFIPFVENAFKYGISTIQSSTIEIKLEVKENRIEFDVINFIIPSENNMLENTGIGINNVKRRLELLYPDKHILTHSYRENHYYVHLEIQLL
jgi:LytS/YehU family sensor histidine kinase